MSSKPKIFLFDAYALIYRAYYAFINRPMINSKGVNTSAIYGFVNVVTDILKKEKPDFAAIVFDPPSPTFRHELYKAYKANRLSTPEEIRKSVPIIKKIIEGFNLKYLEVEGFEADDVIGTLSKLATESGYEVFMVTQDKDYMQLVSENSYIYKPSRNGNSYDIIGIPEVKKTFQVASPEHVVDVLALWGDSSDNIPGAPGFGEKTSKELIAAYKTLENLFLNLNELKPKQREKLEEFKSQIELSQQLAKICTTIPLNIDWNQFAVKEWNKKALIEIFQELEFKTLISRLIQNNIPSPVQGSLFENMQVPHEQHHLQMTSIQTVSHHYEIIQDEFQLIDLCNNLLINREFCFDVETTSLDTREAELVGIAFSYEPYKAYYLPVNQRYEEALKALDILKPVFTNPDIKKIGQNLKFDIKVLLNYDIHVEGALFDTMIAHYLIQPDLKHSLDYLAEVYLNYSMVPIEDLIGQKGEKQGNMRDIELSVIKEYAGEDADITWQLYKILEKELSEKGLLKLAKEVEMPLINVLAEIENTGFRIDPDYLRDYSKVLKAELSMIEGKIFEMAGSIFNINSPRQLGEVLFNRMKIAEGFQKTKTKQFSTSEDTLMKLRNTHPIIDEVFEYRSVQKLISTYVDALPDIINKKTGKIHTSLDQAWVSTGRLSSRNPNLQNIPVKEERGREIRRAFIPDSINRTLVSADYSQIELRLMAHLSKDENMIEAFRQNADIHLSTAAKVFKIPESEVTPAMRSRAKVANFGIIYGISSFGLSQRLNISRTEAADLIQGYFISFPGIKKYMEDCISLARENGYVETIMGRRRYLPDILSKNAIVRGVAERNAINAPIQGSAADIIKLAMVKIRKSLKRSFQSDMILQVHDELIFDVYNVELDAIIKTIKFEMENVLPLNVPLIVDIGSGKSWLEAH